MPGFGIDAIAARSFVRQMVDLNLPPVVFASAGSPDLHLLSRAPRSSPPACGPIQPKPRTDSAAPAWARKSICACRCCMGTT